MYQVKHSTNIILLIDNDDPLIDKEEEADPVDMNLIVKRPSSWIELIKTLYTVNDYSFFKN